MIYKHKIGLVHYTYPPVVGGVERIVEDQAKLFLRHGYRTTVFAGEGVNSENQLSLSIIPEFRSLALSHPDLKEKLLSESSFPAEFYQLKDAIYAKIEKAFADTDIFIIHNILTNILNLPLNAALKNYIENHPEKKFVAWTHDIALDEQGKKGVFRNPDVASLMYQPIDHVRYIAISEFLKQTLTREIAFTLESIPVIYNGIDVSSFFNFDDLTQTFFSKHNLLNSDLLILLPSKVMKHKNIDYCINMIAELKKDIPSVKMVITGKNFPHGKGKYVSYVKSVYDQIKQLGLTDNIIFLSDQLEKTNGHFAFTVVKNLYLTSDIVFFLSSYENFGLPLIEAGLSKTPILCSNLTVFKEIEDKNIFFEDLAKVTPYQMAKKTLQIVKENRQITYFKKIKKKFNYDNIFLDQIVPLINTL